jgi:hypothetical protein
MKKPPEIIPCKLADDPDTYGNEAGKYILTTCDGEDELSGAVYDCAARAEAAAAAIESIARAHFDVETLLTRGSDSLDFYDVSVASIRNALEAAYDAGRKASGS